MIYQRWMCTKCAKEGIWTTLDVPIDAQPMIVCHHGEAQLVPYHRTVEILLTTYAYYPPNPGIPSRA